jgi:hypothetical protein
MARVQQIRQKSDRTITGPVPGCLNPASPLAIAWVVAVAMPRLMAEEFAVLDQRLPLVDRIAVVHRRLCTHSPSIGRVAFALYHENRDLLCTYVSHPVVAINPRFHEQRLAEIPSLRHLAKARCTRVIHDLAAEMSSQSAYNNWLLSQGWQSSYTAPLFCGDGLLGFLFLNSFELAVFQPELLDRIKVNVELLASVLIYEISQFQELRWIVRTLFALTGQQDRQACAHVERVSLYSRLIAIELGSRLGLPPNYAEDLYFFASLSGFGKWSVSVPSSRSVQGSAQQNPCRGVPRVETGVDLLNQIIVGLRLVAHPRTEMFHNLVSGNHERLEGTGYPFGLRAELLPLEARILAVADVYDALAQSDGFDPPLNAEGIEAILGEAADAGRIDHRCLDVLLAAKEQRLAIQYSAPEL